MSADTTSSQLLRPGTTRPEPAPRGLRILALTAVGIGLVALCAATFVLSYAGIHDLALHAGVAPRLARGYPLLIDALLVIVLAAVLALRGAGWASRALAWVTLLAVLAAAAGADALQAVGRKLPHHVAAVTAAVLPWVLVFVAFTLLLAMLRHARLRKLAAPQPGSSAVAPIATGLDLFVRQPPQAAPALPLTPEPDAVPGAAAPAWPEPEPAVDGERGQAAGTDFPGTEPELAVDAEPGLDDPSSDEAIPRQDEAFEQAETARVAGTAATDTEATDAPDADPAGQDEYQDLPDDPDMPVFHRMRSLPTPPEPPEPQA